MVVPLQVTGGVRLWPHMMEQTRFKLLTVEDTFYSVGRGVYVLPNISYASYSGPRERLVTVRNPDGRETTVFLKLIGPFFTAPPKELYYQCLLCVGKDYVPIGTEIWLRSRLQEQFFKAIVDGWPTTGCVETMVLAGADVNDLGSGGWTPLLHATEHRDVDLARLLLDLGADVNRADFSGWTPLHNAVDASLDGAVPGDEPTELIGLLLERGASVSAPDNDGCTPLDVAVSYSSKKVVELLRSWQEHLESQQDAAPSAGSADAPPKQVG